VDGPVNLFALLAQTAQRFPDRGAVYHAERRCCTWQELRDRAQRCRDQRRHQHLSPRGGKGGAGTSPKNSYGNVLKRELQRQLSVSQ
jgi:hypothetical protein